jgi:hypothetical protein
VHLTSMSFLHDLSLTSWGPIAFVWSRPHRVHLSQWADGLLDSIHHICQSPGTSGASIPVLTIAIQRFPIDVERSATIGLSEERLQSAEQWILVYLSIDGGACRRSARCLGLQVPPASTDRSIRLSIRSDKAFYPQKVAQERTEVLDRPRR